MGLRFEAFFYFNKQGRRIERGILPPLRNSGPARPTRNGKMIIFYAVKLKDLFKKERNYPWQKPDSCPCCYSCRLWGHGFADAIFDGYKKPLLLKLYRCPDCGCVIRLRPKGYFKRFQASVETIRSSIAAYSGDLGRLNRRKPATCSGRSRPPKPEQSGHRSERSDAGFIYFSNF